MGIQSLKYYTGLREEREELLKEESGGHTERLRKISKMGRL